jgi:uncharacterized protein (DUF1330 family)
MKTHYTVALGMIAGIAVGAVAVQTLHAQAKPPVYFVAENNVTNPDGYKNEFLSLAGPSIKAHGGRYLAAGSATGLSGDAPKSRVVIIVWDSMEQVEGWYKSPEYQKVLQIGAKYAVFREYVVPGLAQ